MMVTIQAMTIKILAEMTLKPDTVILKKLYA